MSKRTDLASVVADNTLKHGIVRSYNKALAAYVLDNHLSSQLDSLLRDIQADWADQGYLEVLAFSARPLSNEVKSEIKRQIKQVVPEAKTIKVSVLRDEDIIGGVRLSLPGRQLDLSVSAKLNKFKQAMREGKD